LDEASASSKEQEVLFYLPVNDMVIAVDFGTNPDLPLFVSVELLICSTCQSAWAQFITVCKLLLSKQH